MMNSSDFEEVFYIVRGAFVTGHHSVREFSKGSFASVNQS